MQAKHRRQPCRLPTQISCFSFSRGAAAGDSSLTQMEIFPVREPAFRFGNNVGYELFEAIIIARSRLFVIISTPTNLINDVTVLIKRVKTAGVPIEETDKIPDKPDPVTPLSNERCRHRKNCSALPPFVECLESRCGRGQKSRRNPPTLEGLL